MLLFMKYSRDDIYSNRSIAHMCSLQLEELNDLELYTLEIIDFKLFIDEKELEEYDLNVSDLLPEIDVSACFFHRV